MRKECIKNSKFTKSNEYFNLVDTTSKLARRRIYCIITKMIYGSQSKKELYYDCSYFEWIWME